MRWITGYRPIPLAFTRKGTFILHLEQLACPKFVVPYGQPCLLSRGLPLQHPRPLARLLGTGQDPEGKNGASFVLLFIVPQRSDIFEQRATFASAARQVHIGTTQRSAGLRRLSFKSKLGSCRVIAL